MANDRSTTVSNKKPAKPSTPVTPVKNKGNKPPVTPPTYKKGGGMGKKMC